MTDDAPVRILLIEPNPIIARKVASLLGQDAHITYRIAAVAALAEALERLRQDDFDAVILDAELPDARDLEPIQALRETAPAVAQVLLHEHQAPDLLRAAMREGARAKVMKTALSVHELTRALRETLERKALEQEIGFGAIHDPLTRAFNRLHLREMLAIAFAQARRYGHPLSLAVADVDRLSAVNEAHGYQAGDGVLERFGAVALAQCRQADLVGRERGDTFLLVFPFTDAEAAEICIQRIQSDLRDSTYTSPTGRVFPASTSFGLAGMEGDFQSVEDIVAHATKALLEAKKQGGDRLLNWAT